MLKIKEIHVDEINAFWIEHFKYLVNEEIIVDDEDKEYFQSDEYRLTIKNHMLREKDKHHLIYFIEDNIKIGAASYCTYQSEDGKCFILDFWLFSQFRNQGKGHRCFELLEEYTKSDGALYYEINCDGKDNRIRFWKSLGFKDNGFDEYGMQLLIKK